MQPARIVAEIAAHLVEDEPAKTIRLRVFGNRVQDRQRIEDGLLQFRVAGDGGRGRCAVAQRNLNPPVALHAAMQACAPVLREQWRDIHAGGLELQIHLLFFGHLAVHGDLAALGAQLCLLHKKHGLLVDDAQREDVHFRQSVLLRVSAVADDFPAALDRRSHGGEARHRAAFPCDGEFTHADTTDLRDLVALRGTREFGREAVLEKIHRHALHVHALDAEFFVTENHPPHARQAELAVNVLDLDVGEFPIPPSLCREPCAGKFRGVETDRRDLHFRLEMLRGARGDLFAEFRAAQV